MDVLVVGAGGLLGSNVVAAGMERGWPVAGTFHTSAPALDVPPDRVDIRDEAAVAALLEAHAPDAVVNCAAMTDVDGCEAEPETAHAVNGDAPAGLAVECHERDITLVHVSTDYVFDGRRDTPYDETPTRAGAAAATILDLLATGSEGLFHVAARSCVTPYEFGTQLCERLAGDASLLTRGQRAAVDRPAERPAYTCLDTTKVVQTLGRSQPTLTANLDAVELR